METNDRSLARRLTWAIRCLAATLAIILAPVTHAYAQTVGGACTTTGQVTLVGVNPGYLLSCNGSTWVLGLTINSSGQTGIGNAGPGALLDVGTAGTTRGVMRLEGNTSGYVGLQAASAAGSWSMTLPTSGGTSGYCLQTDGTGVTTWGSCTGGGMTTIDLGTAATATNPSRTGTTNTGFYSANVGEVDVAEAGTQVIAWTSAGEEIAPIGAGLSMNSGTYGVQNVVWIPPVAADPDNFSLAIGQNALVNDSHAVADENGDGYNGIANTAVGQEALYTNTGGALNTAVGGAALQYNTIGQNNTAIGSEAMNDNTTGSYNTAIGSLALTANVTGQSNTAVGFGALYVSTGSWNTAIGETSLYDNTTGYNNTAVGFSSLGSNTTGIDNVALGQSTGNANTTGHNNTALGFGVASSTLTTGSGNILLGTSAAVDTPATTTSNFLNIGNAIFATGMTGSLSAPAGSVGIGTTAPSTALQVKGAITAGVNATTTGTLLLANGAVSGVSTTLAPSTATTTAWSMTLPTSGGTSGYCLQTDGTGVTTWGSCTGGGMTTIDLGTAAAATNPSRTGQTGTGFYSATTNTVGVATNGLPVEQWNTLAAAVDYLSVTPGLSGTAPKIAVAGTTSPQSLNFAPNGATGVLQFNGSTVLWQDATNADIVVGASAFPGTYTGGASNAQYNTAVGLQALNANTTGSLNTALGYQALSINSTGTSNTALGEQALKSNSTGSGNLAVGFKAMYANSAGGNNTALGDGSLYTNTTGNNNTVIGYQVANTILNGGSSNILIGVDATTTTYSATSSTAIGIGQGVKPGTADVAIGYQALNATAADSLNNTAIGYQAAKDMTTGSNNTAIGYGALFSNTTGGGNTAIGKWALQVNVSGISNLALGYKAAPNILTSYNVAVGPFALATDSAGANNVALGYQAGYDISSGSQNLVLGYYPNTGVGITTGSNNILIGQNLQELTPANSNQLDIGNLIFATGIGNGATVATGAVGIGVVTPSTTLQVNGAITSGINATTTGSLLLANGAASGVSTTLAPSTATTTAWTMTLPTSAGTSGYVLQTDGTGITSWVLAGSGSGSTTLGTSASATSPTRSGVTNTGFYSAAVNTVGVATNGLPVEQWNTLASAVDYLSVTPGLSGTAPKIAVAGTTSPQNLNFAPNGAKGVIQFGGSTMLWQDNTNFNDLVGNSAMVTTLSQTGGGNNGQYNTAFGYEALNANTTGYENAAIGGLTLVSNTTGYQNVAVGEGALNVNTFGNNNTALGVQALTANISGVDNVAVGSAALNHNTTANYNTAIGQGSGTGITTGSQNTALGYQALAAATTGTGNLALGYQVGSTTLTTGTNNILIGTSNAVTTPAATTANFLNIGNAIFATGMTGTLSAPAGNVGIGTASPQVALHVYEGDESLDSGHLIHFNGAADTNWVIVRSGGTVNTAMLTGNSLNILSSDVAGEGIVLGGNGSSSALELSGYNYQAYFRGQVGIGTTAPSTALQVKGAITAGVNATTTGTLLLANGAASGVSTTLAPSTATTTAWTMTLPTSAGTSGYVLQTDGTGITSWVLAGSGSGSTTLGTSASATSPTRSGVTNTGFYSAAVNTVGVATNGLPVEQWNTLASAVDYLSITPGLSGTAPKIAVAGTTSPQSLNLAPNGAKGVIQFGGSTVLWQDNTNYNDLIGNSAMVATLSQTGGGFNGQYNTAFGYQALNANTTGYENAAIGPLTLATNTTGYQNVAIGEGALNVNTYGNNNTAVGVQSLVANTSGSDNVAIGATALNHDTSGSYNTAAGQAALTAVTTGGQNTGFGFQALAAVTTGTANVALGYTVGSTTLTTGSNNILIGTSNAVTTPAATTSNFLNIGNAIFATGMTGTVSAPAGSVGIGTAAPGAKLTVAASNSGPFQSWVDSNTGVVTGTLYNGSDDAPIFVLYTSSGGNGVQLRTDGGVNYINSGNLGIANINPGALLDLGTAGTTRGVMRLEGTASGYVGLQASAAAGSWSMTLPTSGGTSGYCLQTDGTGITTWGSCTGGSGTAIGLGTAASATNPSRTGTTNTGFYSANVGEVDVAEAGTQVIAWTSAGEEIAPLGAGLSMNSGTYGVQNVVWIPPTSIDSTNFSLALGQNTLVHAVSGAQYNTAVGQEALYENTTGSGNTAIGAAAMQNATTAAYNTGVGYGALNSITTGGDNTAIGSGALDSVTTGEGNVGIGDTGGGGSNITTGHGNVGILGLGGNAGSVSGNNNIAIGFSTMESSSGSISANIAIGGSQGDGIMESFSNGSENVAVGSDVNDSEATLALLASGSDNTAVGGEALQQLGTGSFSTAIGGHALINSISSPNTALGYQAGAKITTGSNNLALGANVASTTLTTGSSNILIGTSSAVDTPAAATSNFLNIGNAIFATGMTGTVTAPAGSVGIGTTAPSTALQVKGAITAGINATTTGTLLLANGAASGVSTTLAPSTATTTAWTMTLPTSAGTSGYVLQTDGTGITSWVLAGSGSGSTTLGTSASATSPTRSGVTNTGFYSAAVNTVGVATNGLPVEQWNTLASAVDYLSITPGLSGTAPKIAVAGTTSPQSLNLAPNGAKGVIQFGGNTILWQDTTNFNIVVGNSGSPATFAQTGSYNGQYNTALGYQALNVNTTGYENIALGPLTLTANTTGIQNVAIGEGALNVNTTGADNTVIGVHAMVTNTTGAYNTAVGSFALDSNVNANASTAVGYYSLFANTAASNTAVGYETLQANTTGTTNTAFGAGVLTANTTGSYNVAVGGLGANTAGNNNTALGSAALNANTTGSNNLALGYSVGSTVLTTGSSNILVGTSSAVTTPAAATSNFLNIGNTIFATGTNTGTVAVPAGSVGIGTTVPSTALQVNGAITAGVNAATTGTLLLANGAASGVSTTLAPSTATTAAWTMTLPTSAGTSGYVLQTDGTGITSWIAAGSGGGSTLGTSAAVTNPSRSGDATTGFYSASIQTVGVAAGGKEVQQWNTAANAVNYLSVTPGATGVASTLGAGGTDTSGAGLGLSISGTAATASGAGGAITLGGGAGNTAGAGGAISANAGQGGATGNGGAIALSAGAGGGTSGTGGAVTINAGAGTAGNAAGGAAGLTAGAGQGSAAGGAATLVGGTGGTTGAGGSISVTAGNIGASATGKAGGNITLTAGSSNGLGENYIFLDAPPPTNAGAHATVEAARVAGNFMSFTPHAGAGAGNGFTLFFNSYYSSNDDAIEYLVTDSAFKIYHDITANVLVFGAAPSGAAGTSSTFSDAIEIAAAGGVGFGSAPASNAAVEMSTAPAVSSAAAYGLLTQQTLTATANGNNLTAVYIHPTFANGAYTGVANNGLIVGSGNVGIGTTTPSTLLHVNGSATLGVNATTTGTLLLANGAASGVSTTLAPSSATTAAWTMTLPTSAGTSGYVLQTDGTGITSWVAAGSGGSGTAVGLGTAASATNPSRTGTTNTGFYSANVGEVDVAEAGTQVIAWTSAGEEIAPLGAGLSMNSGAFGIQNVVWVPPVASDPANFSLAVGQNALPSDLHSVNDVYADGDNGQYNTALGQEALYRNTGGAFNTAVGAAALQANTIGEDNVAVGTASLMNNVQGAANTAVGASTLQANTASNNTGIGNGALQDNTTGAANTALGQASLGDNTTGAYNTALGEASLAANTAGGGNTAVGIQALASNTTANGNTAVGTWSLKVNTTGANNTALGYYVGSATMNGGSGNILIGTSASVDTPAATTNNFLNIGNAIFATGMTGTVSAPAGSVGIGTTSPQAALDVTGSIYSRQSTLAYAATLAVSWATSNVQAVTLTGNTTFTFSNGQAGGRYILSVKQDTTGSRTVTWPAAVRWPGGTSPTLTTTASKTDFICFIYDGTYYNGVAISQNF